MDLNGRVVVITGGSSGLGREAALRFAIGGDINGGAAFLDQIFFRPVARVDPYRTPNPSVFMCSSSPPPGGGVHGMCGYWAARSAVQYLRTSC